MISSQEKKLFRYTTKHHRELWDSLQDSFVHTRKQKILHLGQSQILKIAFDINGIASYDDSGVTGNKSCYVLEAGDYNFYVGNSVKNNKRAYTYKIEELKVTEQLSEAACPNDDNLTLMKPGKRKEDGTYEITYVPSQKPTVDMAKRIEENLPKDRKLQVM